MVEFVKCRDPKCPAIYSHGPRPHCHVVKMGRRALAPISGPIEPLESLTDAATVDGLTALLAREDTN